MEELLEAARAGQDARRRLAELIRESSDEDLVALLGEPGRRQTLLEAVFKQMARGDAVLDRDIVGFSACVHWRIRSVVGEGADSYQMRFSHGRVEVGNKLCTDPMTTIEIAPVDLLRLCGGQVTMVHLIFEERVEVEGDVLLATQFGEISA